MGVNSPDGWQLAARIPLIGLGLLPVVGGDGGSTISHPRRPDLQELPNFSSLSQFSFTYQISISCKNTKTGNITGKTAFGAVIDAVLMIFSSGNKMAHCKPFPSGCNVHI